MGIPKGTIGWILWWIGVLAVGLVLSACSLDSAAVVSEADPATDGASTTAATEAAAGTDAVGGATTEASDATAAPTNSPIPTATPEPSPTATPAPTATATPEPTPTSTPSPTPTPVPIRDLRPSTESALSFADAPGGAVKGWLFASSKMRSTLEPPQEVDGQTWLQIETLDGRTGWMPESNVEAWQASDATTYLRSTLRAVLNDRYSRPLSPSLVADATVESFAKYVSAVNRRDFAAAYAMRSGALNGSMSLQTFTNMMTSSSLSPIVIGQLPSVTAGNQHTRINATVAFVSTQQASQGPGGQTCSVWVLEYDLLWMSEPTPVIDGARALDGSPFSCASLSIPTPDVTAVS